MFPQPWGVPAGSQVGVDALEKALPIIQMFYHKEYDWALNTCRSPILGTGCPDGVGAFTFNPCRITGGNYIGSVMGEVRITYGVWYPNDLKKEDLMREIRDSVAAVCYNDSWLRDNPPEINMPILQDWPGFSTPKDSTVVASLASSYNDALGEYPLITGFRAVCDATWTARAGIPSVVLGAGDEKDRVHTFDESCSISAMLKAAKVYASIMADWGDRQAP